MIVVRKSNLSILLISALLLAAPALAQEKVDPYAEDPLKLEAQGGWQEPGLGPVPPNDLCEDAIAIAVPSITSGTTDGAGIDDPPAFFCGTSVTSPGVWYTVTGNGNTFTANTCTGTSYDSKISVFCQDCANLTCVDGNDDTCGLQSQVTWCTQPGAEYRILVHGFGGATGPFDLTLTDDGVPCMGAVQCLPVGACCDPMGGCTQETEADCIAAGGDYQGDGVDCFIVDIMESATPGLPIDSGLPPAVSTISVADSVTIADVNVDLTITHTFLGDLTITLEHAATTVTLWDGACGSNDDMDVTFDDAGAPVACASPTTGTITPTSASGTPLAAFNGLDSAGDWTLTVTDNFAGDTGTLDAWGVAISSGTTVCDLLGGGGNFDIEIPTLNQVGLAILALLLAGGAIFLIRRRV